MLSGLFTSVWSPYAVGIGIGILSWFTFLVSDKPLGCSTSFATLFGILEKGIRGEAVSDRLYYRKVKPVIDWQVLFVTGIFFGALLSALLSGDFMILAVPKIWEAQFGGELWKRFITGFFGGMLVGFGSRWAGGCTSGHGISGTLQLALSSWVAVGCFFFSGIITANIIYRIF